VYCSLLLNFFAHCIKSFGKNDIKCLYLYWWEGPLYPLRQPSNASAKTNTDRWQIIIHLHIAYLRQRVGERHSECDSNNSMNTSSAIQVTCNSNKPVGFYGLIVPPGLNARRTSCPIPSSERAQIPNFRTRSIPNLWTRPMSSFWTYLFAVRLCHTLPQMGSSSVLRVRRSALVLAASTRWWRRAHSIGWGCHVHTCVTAIWANFKMYLLRQFCSNWVEFFYNTQETQMQQMMDQNFEIRILWFLRIFLNSQKGIVWSLWGRSGTLWSRPN